MVIDTREREQSDAAYWRRGISLQSDLQWPPLVHDDACLDWPIYEEDEPVDEADQRLRSIERLVGRLQGQEALFGRGVFHEMIERIAGKLGHLHEYTDLVTNILVALEVEPEALSRMIGTGDDIDAFLAGAAPLSEAGKQKIREANDSLSLLLRIFRRDRLRDVIRRKAEVFGGDTALDWILAGRIAEVADLYDRALTF